MTTHASPRRRGRGTSAVERAKLLAHYDELRAAHRAADPTTPFREVFKLASPMEIGSTIRSEHHEILRRAFVLKAWAALQIARLSGEERCIGTTSVTRPHGYFREARKMLEAARIHSRLAAAARESEQ